MTRLRHLLILIGFIAMLTIPMVAQIISPQPDVLPAEKRFAATFPETPRTLAEINSWPSKLSDWMEDRFGLRGLFLKAHAKVNDALDLSPTTSLNVVTGQDGWLFFGRDQVVETYMGLAGYGATEELDSWLDSFTALLDRARATGVPVTAMIAPNKPTLYPEKMDPAIPRTGGPTRLEQLLPAAEARGVTILSPISALQAAKADGALVFNRTDTHWTDRGAWEAYRLLISDLQAQGLSVEMLALEDMFSKDRIFANGDLAKMLNPDAPAREEQTIWLPVKKTPYTEKTVDQFSFLSQKTRIVETRAEDRPTLLLIGDSFAFTMIPFLAESFSRIVIVHHQAGGVDPAVFDTYPSDAIIFLMVERFLTKPWGEPTAE